MIKKELIYKHFSKWGYEKVSHQNNNLINKNVWYFGMESEDIKLQQFYRGLPIILTDLFNCEYFSQAKDIIDLCVGYNDYLEFIPSLKASLYDHQQFFIDNNKKLLFEQIEKYVAFTLGNSTSKGDRIITIEHASDLLSIDKKTFIRVYIDTNILVPLFVTPGGANGYNARRGYRLSTIEHFIKNMK